MLLSGASSSAPRTIRSNCRSRVHAARARTRGVRSKSIYFTTLADRLRRGRRLSALFAPSSAARLAHRPTRDRKREPEGRFLTSVIISSVPLFPLHMYDVMYRTILSTLASRVGDEDSQSQIAHESC